MMQPEIGKSAPYFEAPNQRGEVTKLTDFAGKKLVLYFYPKDNTPGCTAQACNLRDNFSDLTKKGYAILGISVNDAKSHVKFIDKYDLPFDLLVDDEQTIAKAYGVWVEKNTFGKKYVGIARTTFIIDEKGDVENIISNVKTADHSAQVLS